MNITKVMDDILGQIIEDISGKYAFECKRVEGFLIIDAPDRSIGVKYINDETVEVMAEYLGEPGVKYNSSVKDAPVKIRFLLTERRGKSKRLWWQFWK